MKLSEFLSNIFGGTTDCPVHGCNGHVYAEKPSELLSAAIGMPLIDDNGRPWIADAPESRTGYIVCNDHNYSGEYLP